MPYFVFHLDKGTNGVLRSADLQDQFQDYRAAKQYARKLRLDMNVKEAGEIKIMFADSLEMAESKLTESRDAPILREWEK